MANNDEQIFLLTYGDIFLNSDFFVIEYEDCIRCIRFSLLRILFGSDTIKELFDLSPIENMSVDELYTWYVDRDERYVFLNFNPTDEFMSNFENIEEYRNWVMEFEDTELGILPVVEEGGENMLHGYKTLEAASKSDVVHKILIYTKKFNPNVEQDISSLGDKVKYVYGDFKEILKKEEVTNNSTFFISDIYKINDIKENGLLPLSSIVLGDYFGYNHDHEENLKIDIEQLTEKTVFKFSECDCNDIIFNTTPPVEEIEI